MRVAINCQRWATARLPEDESISSQAHGQFKLLGNVVRDEDNKAGFSQQQALNTGLVKQVLFGGNEVGCPHFYHWVDQIVEADEVRLRQLFNSPVVNRIAPQMSRKSRIQRVFGLKLGRMPGSERQITGIACRQGAMVA
jgi:hypothetical protein